MCLVSVCGLFSIRMTLFRMCSFPYSENFGFKQGEERFDCGTKAGDVFAGDRKSTRLNSSHL